MEPGSLCHPLASFPLCCSLAGPAPAGLSSWHHQLVSSLSFPISRSAFPSLIDFCLTHLSFTLIFLSVALLVSTCCLFSLSPSSCSCQAVQCVVGMAYSHGGSGKMQRVPCSPHAVIWVLLVGCPPQAANVVLAGTPRLAVRGSRPAQLRSCLQLVLPPDPGHGAEPQLPLLKRGMRRDPPAPQPRGQTVPARGGVGSGFPRCPSAWAGCNNQQALLCDGIVP